MFIAIDKLSGTYTFTPEKDHEQQILTAIARSIHHGEQIEFLRSHRDDQDKDSVVLYFKFQDKMPTHTANKMLVLRGSQLKDRFIINNILHTCQLGSQGLMLLSVTQKQAANSLIFTGGICKICQKNMLTWLECSSGICNACFQQCDHEYAMGHVYSLKFSTSIAEFCTKCYRAKKDDTYDYLRQCGLLPEQRL